MTVLNSPPEPQRISWQSGIVQAIAVETYRAKTFTIQLPQWRPFRPGQHFDVRLTAPDGYQAQRSYSIASAPESEGTIDLTVEVIADGEVSPYFHEILEIGDQIEVRGPIGGPFAWTAEVGGPLLLVAGGSGIVPLMSMARHKEKSALAVSALLLYSARSVEDVIYRAELDASAAQDSNLTVLYTLTRAQPPGWLGYSRRIDQAILEEALRQLEGMPNCYICGPTPFVETAADGLVSAGVQPEKIRTERFGPTGS